MKLISLTYIFLLVSLSLQSQIKYGTPKQDDIPEKLRQLKKQIVVKNFPKIIDPIKIKNRYYWKHNTLIFSKTYEITIIEFGAYLFYNKKYNIIF